MGATERERRMHYFGYCTWLSDPELRKYVPEAVKVTTARARNHKVEFRTAGTRRDRGWCHLADRGDAQGVDALGLVFEVDAARASEQFDDFDIVFLTVHGDDGKVYDCFTYVLTQPGIPMRPPDYYWRHVPDGIAEQRFPDAYRDAVLATYRDAAECPDAGRPAPSVAPSRSASTR